MTNNELYQLEESLSISIDKLKSDYWRLYFMSSTESIKRYKNSINRHDYAKELELSEMDAKLFELKKELIKVKELIKTNNNEQANQNRP